MSIDTKNYGLKHPLVVTYKNHQTDTKLDLKTQRNSIICSEDMTHSPMKHIIKRHRIYDNEL